MTTLVLAATLALGQAPEANPVHAVTDIAHDFSFYFDGRFGGQYIEPAGGRNVMNWGTLHEYDLSNANLLILQSAGTPCPYPAEDVDAVREFLAQGGGVLVLGDYATFRDETAYHLNDLVQAFGAQFAMEPAIGPLTASAALTDGEVETYGGKTIVLGAPTDWEVLVTDAAGRAVLARRSVGTGALIVGSRALAGHNPDASDDINASWWQPLLIAAASAKPVDPSTPPQGAYPEHLVEREGLRLQFSDYMEPYADIIFEIYAECRPVLEDIMGVPPAEGMLASLILLPTDGGGFSSGQTIGLGVWWGDFPDERYGMIELIGHEGAHSWVLPFPEPTWNEPIATYVGAHLAIRLGLVEQGRATIERCIEGGLEHDPDMDQADLANPEGLPNAVVWGKTFWLWEQLRAEEPETVAKYFQAKRRLADPDVIDAYTMHDAAVVLSEAMGRDLFPWLNDHGVRVSRDEAAIRP
ncbi:MAG: hypothetical protein GX134_08115 [candidate division WS1 bacterium]|jgi:hypothetical protein|nr:hypothetical protein [candidate division WS1 bacterium]